MTLTELAVALALMGVVAGLYLTSVTSIQGSVIRQEARSASNDQVRLALQQMDREIRSGNAVYDPATEPVPGGHEGYNLRIQTQANGATRIPPLQCIWWRVKDSRLERIRYHVVAGSAVVLAPWRTVAEGIVNKNVSPEVLPFSMSAEGRLVDIVLLANPDPSAADSAPVRVETSVGIRNSIPFTDPCSPTPPWGG